MKKYTLAAAAAALALSGSAAFASGPSVVIAEPPVYVPAAPMHSAYNWTGGYAGAGLTYGRTTYVVEPREWGMESLDYPGEWGVTLPDSTGPGIGVVLGYNWQNGSMVFGGEFAGVFSRMRGTNDCGGNLNGMSNSNSMGSVQCESRIDNIGAIRARLGVAIDNTLLFVTAGYATSTQRHTIDFGGGDTYSESRRYNGPTVGVGIEHGFSREWSVRGDLEHYRWGTQNFGDDLMEGGIDVTSRTNLARLSLVRRF